MRQPREVSVTGKRPTLVSSDPPPCCALSCSPAFRVISPEVAGARWSLLCANAPEASPPAAATPSAAILKLLVIWFSPFGHDGIWIIDPPQSFSKAVLVPAACRDVRLSADRLAAHPVPWHRPGVCECQSLIGPDRAWRNRNADLDASGLFAGGDWRGHVHPQLA